MSRLVWLALFQFCLANHPVFPPPTQLYCPTHGTSAYIFVTVTPEVDIDAFAALLEYYAKLMPYNSTNQIKYDFYFGANYSQIVKTFSLETDVNEWVHDNNYLNLLYNSALTSSKELRQENSDELTNVVRSIYDAISKENQLDASVYLKKQIVLITDYVPLNVTDLLNNNDNENTQILGIFQRIDDSAFDDAAIFPVFSMEDTGISRIRNIFQSNYDFEFPRIIHETKPTSDVYVFMTSSNMTSLAHVIANAINGPACQLQRARMYSQFVHVQLIQNGTVWQLIIPWLGEHTQQFTKICLNSVLEAAPAPNCTEMKTQILSNFVDHISTVANESFTYLFLDRADCAHTHNLTMKLNDMSHVRIVMEEKLNDVYEEFTLPLISLGFLDQTVDNQVIHNDMFYLGNFSTSCTDEMPMVPLLASRPWRRTKHLYIALDDMLTIFICATISVSTFGCLIYRHVRRTHKKQMELLSEIMLQPRIYKAPRECPKVARLPWEIKSENVHIDFEFLLGEGTISNVYLGKLKGRAPIMQWIERIEMKQFQDCAVAVRVPRHFDEPEEDQLQREIASMRQLRHHDHIALLLGWTDKNNLVCSLLELTHMNLIKYLNQIKTITQTPNANGFSPMDCIPFQTMYKIIWETCDGIEYIHSKNLVHRDLTARNILLTTGLRAKISGFGFCSEPGDPKFTMKSLALRYLPVRWLAPECFYGNFSFKSDSWAFGVLMYEIFTLGDQPYEDLTRPEEIIESVRKGRIPAHPKYATKQTYKIMQSCFETYTSRRPTFTQLKDAFHVQSTAYYKDEPIMVSGFVNKNFMMKPSEKVKNCNGYCIGRQLHLDATLANGEQIYVRSVHFSCVPVTKKSKKLCESICSTSHHKNNVATKQLDRLIGSIKRMISADIGDFSFEKAMEKTCCCKDAKCAVRTDGRLRLALQSNYKIS
ncbi:unnamed protein product [Caenorhabditis bovis]|uniref:Protein kinase domain-containing protein n=1 Tax=Caenorhabditis bovis TaxID=2654633 RepID=A0A8S1EXM0_9PELO|nr:unnamed protein product [Caenorhabditis bovis]